MEYKFEHHGNAQRTGLIQVRQTLTRRSKPLESSAQHANMSSQVSITDLACIDNILYSIKVKKLQLELLKLAGSPSFGQASIRHIVALVGQHEGVFHN